MASRAGQASASAQIRRASYQRAHARALVVWALLPLGLTRCAGYHRKPVVPRDVLRELDAIRLEALSPPPESVSGSTTGFDASDGLTADEAVAVALVLNPDLRAFRLQRGIAEGELVSAELVANPELEVSWLKIERFTRSLATAGLDLGSSFGPPRPGERRAMRARAEARLEEAKAQIAGEEWRLASSVRKASMELLAGSEKLRLAEASRKLQERILDLVRDKRDLGDASRLQVNLAEIEHADAQRERETVAIAHDKAERELRRLLGLPPGYAFELQTPVDPLAYRPFALDVASLESTMIERRPDLRAASQAYEEAEQDLHIAYIERLPWFSLGPKYERDGSAQEGLVRKWGLGFLGLAIPVFNFNQGEIRKLEARRDQVREELTARIHAARAELHAAYQDLEAQERLLRLYDQFMRPALAQNAQLTAASFEMHDVDLLQFVATQDKVLKGRRDFVDSELAYWEAAFDLEQAVGARLSEVAATKE